jgi:hypothetical protein
MQSRETLLLRSVRMYISCLVVKRPAERVGYNQILVCLFPTAVSHLVPIEASAWFRAANHGKPGGEGKGGLR